MKAAVKAGALFLLLTLTSLAYSGINAGGGQSELAQVMERTDSDTSDNILRHLELLEQELEQQGTTSPIKNIILEDGTIIPIDEIWIIENQADDNPFDGEIHREPVDEV
ncbi:MAG: hypothetical protein ISR65_16885 [Bacteriovoracaceae bacterium]|nr:hypothetical protein [Bacteriovoracaceae bacterium]